MRVSVVSKFGNAFWFSTNPNKDCYTGAKAEQFATIEDAKEAIAKYLEKWASPYNPKTFRIEDLGGQGIIEVCE
jgi:hypothetical protein